MSDSKDNKELRDLLLNLNEPIVFKNTLNWKLLQWSLEDWSKYLGEEQLIFSSGNNVWTKEPQWERSRTEKSCTFKRFLSLVESQPKSWFYFDYKYLKDWFLNLKELHEDINWGQFGFGEYNFKDSTIWVGSPGAHTSCHLDTYGCNLVAQIHGRKQWLLFPPSENLKPTRIPYEESSIYSRLNFFSPNPTDFEGVNNCRKITLNPGDVLFVPHKWWHYVENLDTAISINVWLPLPIDHDERLQESIVQLIMSMFTSKLSDEEKLVILNPNTEEHVESLTFTESLNFVTQSKAICGRLGENLPNSTEVNVDEALKKYCIEKIPILENKDFRRFLENQSQRFEEFRPTEDGSLTNELYNTINAFTNPTVILAIRHELLKLQKESNNLPLP